VVSSLWYVIWYVVDRDSVFSRLFVWRLTSHKYIKHTVTKVTWWTHLNPHIACHKNNFVIDRETLFYINKRFIILMSVPVIT
jgi:hypothetical protein